MRENRNSDTCILPETHRVQQTSKEHMQGGKMGNHKSGEEGAPVPTQSKHHKLSCRLVLGPSNPPISSSDIQTPSPVHQGPLPTAVSKQQRNHALVRAQWWYLRVPICLPSALCAAGRWHSRAHTYPECAWHGKSIWPNNQFESSSLPLGTAKTWYMVLTIRTWLSLVFQEQNLRAVKRDFFYFSAGRPLFQLCLWAVMADHPKRSRNSAHPHSSKGPGIRGVSDNHPSRSCRVCSLLSLPLSCCAAAACTRTHHPSRCSQCTDTDTTGECFKHMEAASNLIKTSTHREAQAHPIPQEKHLK